MTTSRRSCPGPWLACALVMGVSAVGYCQIPGLNIPKVPGLNIPTLGGGGGVLGAAAGLAGGGGVLGAADEVIAECRRTGIRVFICGLCIRGQMADELRHFSEATGGVYAPAATLDEIERAFQEAWRLLAANYVVEWVTSFPPGAAGQVRLQYHGRRGEFEAAIRPIQAPGP